MLPGMNAFCRDPGCCQQLDVLQSLLRADGRGKDQEHSDAGSSLPVRRGTSRQKRMENVKIYREIKQEPGGGRK